MIRVFEDLDSLSRAAAETFICKTAQAIQHQGVFNVALSGGNTPHRLYELLAGAPYRDQVSWQAVHVFWGDERCVPLDDPRSNYHMARIAFLDHLPIPAVNIHPINGSIPPRQSAAAYELAIKRSFGSQTPIFNLIFLGLGKDAHTASLFPHSTVLQEKERWVSDVFIAEQKMHRVTFTVPLINQAEQVVFLVSGKEKAYAVRSVLEGPNDPEQYPAQLVRPSLTSPTWMLDIAAAELLTVPIESHNKE